VTKFAPSIARFTVDKERGIIIDEYIHLRGISENPLSGISSTKFDDTPYGPNCAGEPLSFDKNGIDPEDVHPIPRSNGILAIVEEYSPSILLSKPGGTVFARYAPETIAPLLEGADMMVYGTVPDIFKNRRKNRGFESLVVAPDGSYLIAILQSPMGDQHISEYNANRVIRAAVFDVENTGNETEPIKLTYRKQFAIEGSPPSAYFKNITASDLKYSAAESLSDGTFIALERASGQVKYFNIDWRTATNLDDTRFANNLRLEFESRGTKSLLSLGVTPASKIKVMDTYAKVPGGVDNFTGSAKQEGFLVTDENTIVTIEDNDFGLENNGNVKLHVISVGRELQGSTVCGRPKVPRPPTKKSAKGLRFSLKNIITLSNEPDVAKAEIVSVDEKANVLYAANADEGTIDAYRAKPLKLEKLASKMTGDNKGVNSVDVCKVNGLVAAAVEDLDGGPGTLLVLEPRSNSKGLTVGFKEFAKFTPDNCFLPDSVKWNFDCSYIVVACEGEGADVPGGVLIWDALTRSVNVATFDAYDNKKNRMRLSQARVRYFQNNAKPSLALEPEFSAYTSDGNYAYVTLQENNALAVVDLAEAKIVEIKPLIYTPRFREGYGIDASDVDGKINIRTYPRVYGMCQPDAIVSYSVDGKDYFVVACEGDAWDDIEEIRAGDIESVLNRTLADELKPLVADESLLGRLEVSYPMGYDEKTNTQVALYHFGARSFQIYDTAGSCVLDSGDWIEQIHAQEFPEIFNAETETEEDLSLEDNFDARSDAKGPEPESVFVANINGRMILFVGNERTSVIMAYDISEPKSPIYLASTLQTPTNISGSELFKMGEQGLIDPESLTYANDLLYVGAAYSSTIGSLKIKLSSVYGDKFEH